jgi:hypothetical protein
VLGPGTNSAGFIPIWNGANSKTLANGIDPATMPLLSGSNVYTGSMDSSGATSTSPNKVGLVSAIPGTCTVGQTYFESDGVPGRKLQSCTATNTWTPMAYDQGLLASRSATCAVGQIYFITNATAGQNLSYCTATNTWTQQLNSGGGGAMFSTAGSGYWWPFGQPQATTAVAPPGTAACTTTCVMDVVEFVSPGTMTVSKIVGRTGSGGTAGVHTALAIYNADGTLNTACVTGQAPTPGQNFVCPLSAPVTLSAGPYLLAIMQDGTNGQLTSLNDAQVTGAMLNSDTVKRYFTAGSTASISGVTVTWPGTIGTRTSNALTPPLVVFMP